MDYQLFKEAINIVIKEMQPIAILIIAITYTVKNINSGWKKRKQLKIKKDVLKNLLHEKKDGNNMWRNIHVFSNACGANKDETRTLLLELGARGSTNSENKNMWGIPN